MIMGTKNVASTLEHTQGLSKILPSDLVVEPT